MGYEIKLLIGKSGLPEGEIERDMERPYADGSGYEYKKDSGDAYVLTGRKQAWFQIMAEIDLCKLGYQDDPLNNLIRRWHQRAQDLKDREVLYFYGTDGNTEYKEDRYEVPLIAVPLKDCLKAMKASHNSDDPYRRLTWAIALLESMKDDPEALEVVFYGH